MYDELVKHLRFCGKCNDAMECDYCEYNNTTEYVDRACSESLMLQAADVRPVVLCRDCIHWKKSELVICGNYDMVCDYHLGARYCRHADDFCSKGERRADE